MNYPVDYNSIAAADTPEAWWVLRDQFLQSNHNESLDSNLFSIRILSSKEYEKYIVNGTCDGAITKANINVWNTCVDYICFMFWYYDTGYGYNPSTTILQNAIRYKNVVLQCYGLDMQPWIDKNAVFGDIKQQKILSYTSYEEYLQNNEFGKAFKTNKCKHIYAVASSAGGVASVKYKSRFYYKQLLYSSLNKNATNSILTFTISDVDFSPVINNNTYITNLSFRPVFQYKDNNKSNNVYY